jgi:hypothetical protein
MAQRLATWLTIIASALTIIYLTIVLWLGHF